MTYEHYDNAECMSGTLHDLRDDNGNVVPDFEEGVHIDERTLNDDLFYATQYTVRVHGHTVLSTLHQDRAESRYKELLRRVTA